jgi:hypothetical protein
MASAIEGRASLHWVTVDSRRDDGSTSATVHAVSGATYAVTRSAAGVWRCPCAARRAICSHVVAVQAESESVDAAILVWAEIAT